ncbi:MAG: hypothetical protein Q9170_002046 [Blastenia crenularia]
MARHERASNILDLMMPTFSGTKDDFGKELVPPLPLLFDRVSEGRNIVSEAPLLSLPMEIIALILRNLHSAALASLAFVNSDCRQLARSRQFASLHFDYSDRAIGLIHQLLDEASERMASNGLMEKMALGPCIRRVTIATHPGWVTYRHGVELSDEFVALTEVEQNERLNAACESYFDSYLSSIESLLLKPAVLPHLELLDWEDTVSLQPSFFDAMAKSTARHLKIKGPSVSYPFRVNTSNPWPLRSLNLEMFVNFKDLELDMSPLYTSLLCSSASTLKSLEWGSRCGGEIRTDLLGPCPSFPLLRNLRLLHLRLVDATLLKELVQDKLVALDADTESSTISSTFFANRGSVPALETFVWNTPHIQKIPCPSFLQANPQIRKLNLQYAVNTVYLEERILPLLAHQFSNLRSLYLIWDSKDIPQTSLDSISKITTLEQLSISAGEQYGWRHDWYIDHDTLRAHLCQLKSLKRLAVSRDTYSTAGFTKAYDRYYECKWQRFDDSLREDWTDEMFEIEHRERMLQEATRYIEVLPQLHWVYLGQIPMAIEEDHQQNTRIPRPLTLERDDCWTLLREMFGWKGLSST